MTNTLCLILDNQISETEILCGISNLLWILPEGEVMRSELYTVYANSYQDVRIMRRRSVHRKVPFSSTSVFVD